MSVYKGKKKHSIKVATATKQDYNQYIYRLKETYSSAIPMSREEFKTSFNKVKGMSSKISKVIEETMAKQTDLQMDRWYNIYKPIAEKEDTLYKDASGQGFGKAFNKKVFKTYLTSIDTSWKNYSPKQMRDYLERMATTERHSRYNTDRQAQNLVKHAAMLNQEHADDEGWTQLSEDFNDYYYDTERSVQFWDYINMNGG